MHVSPIKLRSEVTLDMKKFANNIGVTEEIIIDATRDEKNQQAKQFLNRIRKTSRALEE